MNEELLRSVRALDDAKKNECEFLVQLCEKDIERQLEERAPQFSPEERALLMDGLYSLADHTQSDAQELAAETLAVRISMIHFDGAPPCDPS